MWTSATVSVSETISEFNSSRSYSPNPAVTFSHLDGILIESQQPRPVESFRPFEHRFRALVNLLGDCQLEILSLKCRQEIDQPPEVEVFGDVSRVPFGTRRDARRGAMPLPFSSLQNFSEVLARWTTLYERLEPVVNLYLFGKHNSHFDIGNMFLGVMQALEAYHRSFLNGSFMTADQYDADVRPVLNAAIPPSSKGRFANVYSPRFNTGMSFHCAAG
jgi:ApeA N-terminal domain 1